jgi:nucleotide-binding universal stress UspA family protein
MHMVSIQSHAAVLPERSSRAGILPLKVLVVVDGSERTGRVIEYVSNLASHGRPLQLVLLGVAPAPATGRLRGYGSFKRAEIHHWLKEDVQQRAVAAVARRLDHEHLAHSERIEVGDPAEVILRVASEEGVDLILLADAPAGAMRRLLPAIGLTLATVVAQVIQSAKVPVVTVK